MADSSANAALLTSFYESFSKGDSVGMNAVYAPDVVFSDPVFGELHGDNARAMWTMLAAALRQFTLEFEVLDASEEIGHGRCVATYLYSATGRMVRNEIAGTFAFRNGLVARQDDVFDYENGPRKRSAQLACCSDGRRPCKEKSVPRPPRD